MRARRLIGLATAMVLASAIVAGAADRPPANLHFTGDHWTAWQPPTEFPEGAQLYLIERGDTLWDLAARFFGNPYLWPQIWEQNRYILDAHWIYPRDPLVVGIEVTPIEDLAAEREGGAYESDDTTPGAPDYDVALGAPAALGGADDIYCTGYIGELEEPFDLRLVGSEYSGIDTLEPRQRLRRRVGRREPSLTAKLGLLLGDIVYLNRGEDAGLVPGSVYFAVDPGRVVRHVVTDKTLGRVYHYRGRVRVLSVQETASIGEIIHSCGPVQASSVLKPFEPVPVPLARRTPLQGVNDPAPWSQLEGAPIIAVSDGDRLELGEGHLVFIDRGEEDVTPGDIFTIYRLNAPHLPPMVVGELAVLTVDRHAALARIVESRSSIHIGDRLDPK